MIHKKIISYLVIGSSLSVLFFNWSCLDKVQESFMQGSPPNSTIDIKIIDELSKKVDTFLNPRDEHHYYDTVDHKSYYYYEVTDPNEDKLGFKIKYIDNNEYYVKKLKEFGYSRLRIEYLDVYSRNYTTESGPSWWFARENIEVEILNTKTGEVCDVKFLNFGHRFFVDYDNGGIAFELYLKSTIKRYSSALKECGFIPNRLWGDRFGLYLYMCDYVLDSDYKIINVRFQYNGVFYDGVKTTKGDWCDLFGTRFTGPYRYYELD